MSRPHGGQSRVTVDGGCGCNDSDEMMTAGVQGRGRERGEGRGQNVGTAGIMTFKPALSFLGRGVHNKSGSLAESPRAGMLRSTLRPFAFLRICPTGIFIEPETRLACSTLSNGTAIHT